MFSNLIKSEARKAILQLLTKNSRQKYYLRELASMIQYSPGSLQRELNSLVESGLILSEKMGNLRFFSLNQKCPLLKELRIYLSQHAAPKQEGRLPVSVQKTHGHSIKAKKNRPVLEQNISKNIQNFYSEKQDTVNEKLESPTQPTIQSTTQVITPAPPPPPTQPTTPFSYIEPPTFSKPVLHKPYLEKPRHEPHTSEPTYTPTFQPNEPPVAGGDIEIHIE